MRMRVSTPSAVRIAPCDNDVGRHLPDADPQLPPPAVAQYHHPQLTAPTAYPSAVSTSRGSVPRVPTAEGRGWDAARRRVSATPLDQAPTAAPSLRGSAPPRRRPVPGSMVMPWACPARSCHGPQRSIGWPRRSSSANVRAGKRASM